MPEVYYNITFYEDRSLRSRVNNQCLTLDEDLLLNILSVSRDGIRYIIGRTCSAEFMKECSEIPDAHRAGLLKKLTKDEYQRVFKFVDKVLLSRMEKRL